MRHGYENRPAQPPHERDTGLQLLFACTSETRSRTDGSVVAACCLCGAKNYPGSLEPTETTITVSSRRSCRLVLVAARLSTTLNP
jgi:hypothetical protein